MNYLDALRYLYGFADMERGIGFSARSPREYTFSRVARLLEALGDPQRGLRFVHIAGSKGKGSTAAMIESIARAAGLRTGLYTQPHLHTFTERIRVDGKPIAQPYLGRLTARVAEAVEACVMARAGEGSPTTYEVVTAAALRHFADVGVDLAVIEVGLGGSWDATNVITPLVSVITSLALEHTAILGDTLEKIAAQKAGIAKAGVPLVCVPQPAGAMEVIRERCEAVGAKLLPARAGTVARDRGRPELRWRGGKPTQVCRIDTGDTRLSGVLLPLLGEHQLLNAGAACVAVEVLRKAGLPIHPDAFRNGLQSVEWPCRIEILGRSPLVVADGGHTPEAVGFLVETLSSELGVQRARVVFGTSADKRQREMLQVLGRIAAKIYVSASHHPRAAAAPALMDAALAAGLDAEAYASVGAALSAALREAGEGEAVVATGSLFVAAEVRQEFGLAEFVDPELIPRAV